jgi:hypothetical protein
VVSVIISLVGVLEVSTAPSLLVSEATDVSAESIGDDELVDGDELLLESLVAVSESEVAPGTLVASVVDVDVESASESEVAPGTLVASVVDVDVGLASVLVSSPP